MEVDRYVVGMEYPPPYLKCEYKTHSFISTRPSFIRPISFPNSNKLVKRQFHTTFFILVVRQSVTFR